MIMMAFMSLCEINNGSKIILCWTKFTPTLSEHFDGLILLNKQMLCLSLSLFALISNGPVSCLSAVKFWGEDGGIDCVRKQNFIGSSIANLVKISEGRIKTVAPVFLLTKLIFVLFMYSWNYKRTLRLGYGIESPNLCNTKQEWCLFTNNNGTDVQSTWSTFKISWL